MLLHDVGKTLQHPMEESMKTVLYIPILCLKWSQYSKNKIIIVWQKCYTGLPYHVWMKPARMWRCCYQQMDRKENTLLKNLCSWKFLQIQAGRIRTVKIGVGAGADIGGTGISCNFIARQYTGPTRQSYRDDHRHVGAMPATPSINRPAFSHLYARRGSVVQLSVPR